MYFLVTDDFYLSDINYSKNDVLHVEMGKDRTRLILVIYRKYLSGNSKIKYIKIDWFWIYVEDEERFRDLIRSGILKPILKPIRKFLDD